MSERKMLQIELDPPYEITWAEKKDILFHCLRWRDENPALTDWLETTPDDDVIIHIAGNNIAPDVVSLDMENLIEVERRSPTQDAIAEEKGWEITFQLSKSEALRIAREGKDDPADNEKTQRASLVYAEVMKSRFEGEPFVYLTCKKRTLPIKVNVTF